MAYLSGFLLFYGVFNLADLRGKNAYFLENVDTKLTRKVPFRFNLCSFSNDRRNKGRLLRNPSWTGRKSTSHSGIWGLGRSAIHRDPEQSVKLNRPRMKERWTRRMNGDRGNGTDGLLPQSTQKHRLSKPLNEYVHTHLRNLRILRLYHRNLKKIVIFMIS